MTIEHDYDTWAGTYDAVTNPTRDLEAQAIRAVLPAGPFAQAIELGCGTGKNTAWLATKAARLTAVDFSGEMLRQAQAKCAAPTVHFQQADITQPWAFAVAGAANLITCSLMLEHIADLGAVFDHVSCALAPGGLFYLGELHPFKQYQGSKARFETTTGVTKGLTCFTHHISSYFAAAGRDQLRCEVLDEWFDADADSRAATPRILSLLFRKEGT